MRRFENVWKALEDSFTLDQDVSALSLCIYMLIAAVFALYVRLLFRRFSTSASDTDSISRVFPLLALVTTAVIAVVKSSLALSLGLVGALSIVRFRAAIKDPEELVYLFLCIAIGLALGAEQPLLACALVAIATCVITCMSFFNRGTRQQRLLLTITGESDEYFAGEDANVVTTLDSLVERYTLQRFDVENGRGQMRVVLDESSPQRTAELMVKLRQKLPNCELSYVNLNSVL